MRFGAWFLIVALFISSAGGITISIILWSRAARDAILRAWVAADDKSKSNTLYAETAALYEDLMRRLMLSGAGSVSKIKMLLLTLLSVAALYLTMNNGILFSKEVAAVANNRSDLSNALLVLGGIGFQWLFEFSFSSSFLKRYFQERGGNWRTIILHSLASGCVTLLKVWAGMVIFAVFLLFLSAVVSSAELSNAIIQLILEPMSSNGFGMLVIYIISLATGDPDSSIVPVPMLVLVLCLSGLAVTLLIASVTVINSPRVLRVFAQLCLHLAGLATGLMQAFTFFPMPK
jgi:hypothetical protein